MRNILKTIENIFGAIVGGIIAITAIVCTIGLPLILIFGIPILIAILLVKLILKI